MKQVNLTANLRSEYGKSVARKLRRDGLIPAILYGQKKEAVTLSLNSLDLEKIMTDEAIESTLIGLTIKTGGKTQKKTVVLKEIQVDPVKRDYLHVDFYEVDMSEKIVVPISIHFVGKAKGVEDGGVLQQIKREVDVKCLPSEIPEHFEIDVSNLGIGDSIHLDKVEVNEGVEIIEDLSLVIVAVQAPTVIEEKEVEEEEVEVGEEEGEEEKEGKEVAKEEGKKGKGDKRD